MSANPHANGGLLLRELAMPDFRDYAVPVERPATGPARPPRCWASSSARRHAPQPRPLPALRARRGGVQPAVRGLRGDRAGLGRDHGSRRRAPRPGRPGHGGPLRAPVPGLARGLPAHRPARAVHQLRGVHPHRRLDAQPARQMAQDHPAHPLARAARLAELPALLARVAAGPQRVQPPGPGLPRPRDQQEGRGRPRLPAARHQHPALGGRPLPAQPALRQRHRGRQAARSSRTCRWTRPSRTAPAASGSGTGRARPTASPTSSWPARATSPPWRPWPPRSCCASTTRTSGCGWSTSST